MVRVSIGLPVFNGEVYLVEALDSILAQSEDDFELILSDNASTDHTQEICRRYAEADARVRYSRLPENLGAAYNYNRVLQLSRGEYFKWAAHDDLLHPAFLERCLEELTDGSQDCALVFPTAMVIDDHGNAVRPLEDRSTATSRWAPVRAFQVLQGMGLMAAIFGVFRTDVLRQTRGLGSFPSADYVLLLETALAARIVRIPGEPLFFRRVHPGMSRLANTSTDDVRDWFDPRWRDTPSVRPRPTDHRRRLWLEYLRAIGASGPLDLRFRAGAVTGAAVGLGAKSARVSIGRWRRQRRGRNGSDPPR